MDRVRWGPIVAGVFTAIASLIVLTVLGLAIGLAAFDPDDLGTATMGNAAAVWGIISAIIAFMLGGYVAAYSGGVTGTDNGALNGVMVGVASIVLMLWFVGAGLGNVLGAVAGNLDAVMQVGSDLTGADPAQTYEAARTNSWITLVGLLGALETSALGGVLGHRERSNVFAPERYDRGDYYDEGRRAA
jgi:hypothetical protein